ncbi:DDE-type integrase/transposase/recombinase [Micromonospora psammae]|uniref:DDE-type integrase/transposase/recombinase n=1 Tax=Micromonospora sp. CPCC 205556 TaxID=3122398 RepID=UPI003FA5CFDF
MAGRPARPGGCTAGRRRRWHRTPSAARLGDRHRAARPGLSATPEHSQLKHRLRPMRGLRTDTTAQVIIAGHAFMQNLRRGHYELAIDTPPALRVAAAFAELAQAI